MRNFNNARQDQLKKRGAVLITGASSGLGLAFSYEFASHGFDVVMTARNEEILTAEAEKIKEKYGVDAAVYISDLSVNGAAQKLYEQIKSDGRTVSVLVNNAGAGTCGESRLIGSDKDTDMINVNITSATVLSKLYANEFVEAGGGAICNVCSVGAFQPGPYTASYYASKAYLYNYTLALRCELSKYGVAVTALCPGSIDTPFFGKANAPEPKNGMDPAKVAGYGYKSLMKNKKTAICPFYNRLALIVPKSVRSAYVAKIKNR